MWSFIMSAATLSATLASIWLIWQSVKASRDVQKQEFRAYVAPKIGEVQFENFGYRPEVIINNYGRTPAHNVHGSYSLRIYRMPEIELVFGMSLPFVFEVLHPVGPVDVTAGIAFGGGGELRETDKVFHAIVTVDFSYADVFGKTERATDRRMYAISTGNMRKIKFTVSQSAFQHFEDYPDEAIGMPFTRRKGGHSPLQGG